MSTTSLLLALAHHDPAVRVPAEQQIEQAKEADFAHFILTVLTEFREEGKDPVARQMAGTLLKNAVAPSYREVAARQALEDRWKQLPAPVRQQVKSEVVGTLGSTNQQVRSVAANVVGSLARIELPAGEWPELIDLLVQAAQCPTPHYQEAALTALGYICEEGHDHEEVEAALEPHTNKMLNAIVQCMSSTNSEVQYSATNALTNSMEYIHENMDQQDQRDYLLDALCTIAGSCPNNRTRERSMESLVKVADLYYNKLPAYISRIHEITTNAIFNDEENVGLQALSFWIAIAEQEQDMKLEGEEGSLHYTAQGQQFLVDTCLQLLVRQEEGQTEDDWNLSIAASKLLSIMAEVLGTALHTSVMQFVYANVDSPDWHKREAAITAFGCLLSVEDDDARAAIRDTVAQAANENGLLKYINDANPVVADSTGWLIGVICANFVDVFLAQPPLLEKLLAIVLPMITNFNNQEMFKRACDIVNNLSLAYEDVEEDPPTNELSPYYSYAMQALREAIQPQVPYDQRRRAQTTLNALISAAAVDAAESCLLPMVPELQSQLHQLLTSLQQGNRSEEVEGMVEVIAGALADVARKLKAHFGPFADPTLQMMVQVLSVQTDYIQAEVLMAIASISYATPQLLVPYLAGITSYIVRVLQSQDEPDSVLSVVATLGDLCLSCRQEMRPHIGPVMNAILTGLADPDYDRDLKCAFLQCIGDIALNVLCGSHFRSYIPPVMTIGHQMYQASCTIDVRGDPESEEYVLSLWHSLCEMYSNVIQGASTDDVTAAADYFGNVVQLVFTVTGKTVEEDTFFKGLTLLGDLASVVAKGTPQLRQMGREALLTKDVSALLHRAHQTYRQKSQQKQIRWVERCLNDLQR